MRGLRSFLALLAILIGLGAYLYFVESKRTPGSENDKDKVFSVEASAIEEVAITADTGEQTTVRKDGENWQIVEPITTAADSSELSSLTSSLASLEIQRVVAEQATDLDQYGLENPRFQVRFKAGDQEHRLSIGLKTPPGSDFYARLNDEPRVFLIASYLESTFNKKTFDLRDKQVLRADRSDLSALEIRRGKATLAFERTDGDWRLTQPLSSPAEYSEVNSLVTQITSAQMRSIEDQPKDLKAYGLAQPAVTVRAGSGDMAAILMFGNKAEDDTTVYAKLESRPQVFTVDSSLLDALQKPVNDFRQKDLFNARTFNTNRVEITHGGQTLVFEKRKTTTDGKEEEKWHKVAPAEAEVDGANVDSLISAATGTRAESFVDDQRPPTTPELVIAFAFGEGKHDHVAFWRSGDNAYASRVDVPGAARIGVTTLDDIIKALEPLK